MAEILIIKKVIEQLKCNFLSVGFLLPYDMSYNELKSFNSFQEAVESKVFKGLNNG